ncbi:MAG: hypothetical protein OXU79_00390 [Gemmatimonadota bacterium]|nr:hypothetical protein [Gemmatimonadota bacterium]
MNPLWVADSELDGNALRASGIPIRRNEFDGRRLHFFNRDIWIEVGIDGQIFGGARRENPALIKSIRHDVPIIAEVMIQSKRMPQFMGDRKQSHTAGDQYIAVFFRTGRCESSSESAACERDFIDTKISDDQVNVGSKIIFLFNFRDWPTPGRIVAVRVLTNDVMHLRLALCIGLNAKGLVAVAMRFHLLAIEGLNPANHYLHRIHHLLAKRTVFRQEVDHPYGARFAHVQVRRPFGRRVRMIAPQLFVVEGAEMHAVGLRG